MAKPTAFKKGYSCQNIGPQPFLESQYCEQEVAGPGCTCGLEQLQRETTGPDVALLCLQRFAAVIMRIRDPKTTALIFKSGKLVCGFPPVSSTRKAYARLLLDMCSL